MRPAEPAKDSYSPDGAVCALLLWGHDLDESPNAADGSDFDPWETGSGCKVRDGR